MILNKSKTFHLYLSACLAVLLTIAVMALPKKAFAIGDSPVVSAVAPISGSSQVYPNGGDLRPYFAVGIGSFNGEDTYAKIFVPAGTATATVTITEDCSLDLSGTSPIVTYTAYPLTSIEDSQKPGIPPSQRPSHVSRNCTGKQSFPLTLTGGGKSQIKGHENYLPYYLDVHIDNPRSQGDVERSFQVSVDSGGVVSYSRTLMDWPAQFNTFGIYQRNISGLSSPEWNFAFQFAPRCDEGAGGNKIVIFDADATGSVNSNYQPQNISAALYQQNRYSGTGWAGGPQTWNASQVEGTGGDATGSGSHSGLGFNYDQHNKYKFQLNGVNWRNTIQIAIPFDQFDASSAVSNACGSPPSCIPGQPGCTPSAVCVGGGTIDMQPGGSGSTTVTLNNNGGTPWTSAFKLVRTGSIPGGADGFVNGANPPSPPVNPGQSRQFSVTVRLPATTTTSPYTVNFQMRDASGNNFGARCGVTINVQSRPDCYIRFRGGATNTSTTLPYPGGPVTVDAQILNPGPTTWGNRYFMTEEHNGVRRNLGYLTSVVPGAFTANFPQNYTVSGTTTFNYQVWVVPGPPTGTVTNSDLAAFKAANPPPAIPYSPTTGIAAGTMNCPITAYVTPPIVQGSIGGSLGANCRVVNYEIHWEPASGNAIRTIIRTYSGGQHDRDVTEAPGTHSFDPFTDPAFNTVPMDQPVSYQLFAQNADGSTFSDLGTTTIGPCLTHTCNAASGIDVEPGETTSITNVGGFSIDNQSNRNDPFTINTSISGGSAVYTNPYNFIGTTGGHNVPASSISATTNTMSITRSLVYRGAVIDSCQDTVIPKSRPYLKVFGADVSAGGWFNNGNTSCASDANVQAGGNKGGIFGFASPNVGGHNYRSGSSSEFAAFALGNIENTSSSKYGFYTWSQGNNVNSQASITSFSKLTFANTPSTGNLGFSSGSNTASDSCIKDYYSNVATSGATTISGSKLGGIPAGGGTNTNRIFNHGTSSFSINGAWNFKPGERLTIYAQGDVYINTDILLSSSILNPSYFTLIVKGNIYIGSNVKTLEGLYVAQPTSGTNGGNIWSCAVSGAGGLRAPTTAEIASACKTKLVINGAVVAKHMTFNRVGDLVNNTLSRAPANEGSTMYGGTNNAMEEINYIPEMVTGSPLLNNTDNSTKFDSITVLPPIF